MMRVELGRAVSVAVIVAGIGIGPMACKPAGSAGNAGGNTAPDTSAPAAGAAGAIGATGAAGAVATSAPAAVVHPFAPPATPSSSTPIAVTSATFQPGSAMPTATEFSGCGGGNTSPQLSWSGAPPNTKSFVVTAFDPDAPTSTGFWHWVVYNIPATVTTLPAGAGANAAPVAGAGSGYTDFGFNHYGGPCPPTGDSPHHYIFTVYALDVPKLEGASAKSTGAVVMFSMRGHLLAEGNVEGTFARQ
jgi:Raf kinase inhibitor-like YbhB/YbcL family protein